MIAWNGNGAVSTQHRSFLTSAIMSQAPITYKQKSENLTHCPNFFGPAGPVCDDRRTTMLHGEKTGRGTE
jgi:hypothetical protein